MASFRVMRFLDYSWVSFWFCFLLEVILLFVVCLVGVLLLCFRGVFFERRVSCFACCGFLFFLRLRFLCRFCFFFVGFGLRSFFELSGFIRDRDRTLELIS